MPLNDQIIKEARQRYWREQDRYRKLSQAVADRCKQILENHAIRGSVQWRAKDPDRLERKLRIKYLPDQAAAERMTDLLLDPVITSGARPAIVRQIEEIGSKRAALEASLDAVVLSSGREYV